MDGCLGHDKIGWRKIFQDKLTEVNHKLEFTVAWYGKIIRLADFRPTYLQIQAIQALSFFV